MSDPTGGTAAREYRSTLRPPRFRGSPRRLRRAGPALLRGHLYETTREWATDLDAAMRSRAVIEQAKGVLMSQRRCDAAQAFDLLAEASQRSNRKVRDIAASHVAGVSGAPPTREQRLDGGAS